MDFTPHTSDEVLEMLVTVGVRDVDGLFATIPQSVRLGRALDLPAGISEMEAVEDLASLAARNRSTDDLVCFAGGGAYDHFVPSVVWALAQPMLPALMLGYLFCLRSTGRAPSAN